MLRLPQFKLATPNTVAEAVKLLESPNAMVVAGGTDLLPNMKHELFTPDLLVSLQHVAGLQGIRRESDGALVIGAMTSLEEVGSSELVRTTAPAVAQAASLVAGPQLRAMGTLGGNVLLDTRCQWYNQSHFWRRSLGYCLKKDGSKCHVVETGAKCVAAASNDTAPALMTVDAELVLEGPNGRRTLPIVDFWVADGVFNKRIEKGELLVEIRIPPLPAGHHGAYGKLRDRGSIDFPLLGIAVRLDLDAGVVCRTDVVITALQARPLRIRKVEALAGQQPGTDAFRTAVEEVAQAAWKQCHPMPNIPGDHEYRREMVPVYVRRTLLAASEGKGPVHHV